LPTVSAARKACLCGDESAEGNRILIGARDRDRGIPVWSPGAASLEAVRRTFDTNFFGSFAATQAMLPLLK